MADLDACAVRPDGTLKEASKIEWLHSPTSENNLPLPAALDEKIVDNIFDNANSDDHAQAPTQGKNLPGA